MGPTLVRADDRSAAVELLLARAGGRLGLPGMLDELDRTARPVCHQLTRLDVAFAWEGRDRRDLRWWPQGVTGSWDVRPHAPSQGQGDGDVLLTTAYAKRVRDVRLGSRLTVHDVSDLDRVRYDHVLLVDASIDETGELAVRPVHAHAGGAAWVGRHVHVAATRRGFRTFALDDVVPADAVPEGHLPPHGHRFVLPVRATYRALGHHLGGPLRFSFLSVTHEVAGSRLLVGEYGHGRMTTRLWTYPLDPDSGLPATDAQGVAAPTFLAMPGVPRTQGAVLVDDVLHVASSRGRLGRGSIWTEREGRLVQHQRTLPPGPEDLSHRPATDHLWSLTEYPYSRMVLAVHRSRFR